MNGKKAEEIFQREGTYIIEEAYIVTEDLARHVPMKDAFLEVQREPSNKLTVHGKATVRNASIVELLEEYEKLDIVIDMGEGFKFYLRNPIIQGGKVFSPNILSTIRFMPTESFELLQDGEYKKIKTYLEIQRRS